MDTLGHAVIEKTINTDMKFYEAWRKVDHFSIIQVFYSSNTMVICQRILFSLLTHPTFCPFIAPFNVMKYQQNKTDPFIPYIIAAINNISFTSLSFFNNKKKNLH